MSAIYLDQSRSDTAPKIVEIDSLNLDDRRAGPSLASAELPSIGVSAVQLGLDPAADRRHDLAPQPHR